jgi:hypothetical protein
MCPFSSILVRGDQSLRAGIVRMSRTHFISAQLQGSSDIAHLKKLGDVFFFYIIAL